MTTFLALYRGKTVGGARIVAVSADPALVAYVAGKILDGDPAKDGDVHDDPAIDAMAQGRRQALSIILGGESDRSGTEADGQRRF